MSESFMDKLKNAANKVADGAKDLAGSTKLKMDISGLQGKVKDAKQEFGVNIYAMLEQGKTLDDITGAFAAVQAAVNEFNAQIAAKQEELKKIGDDNA
jgi:predicted  nucleic acid-binding Zn-ribbon protein